MYKNGPTVLGDLTYEYDKAGNRTKVGGTWARSGLPQGVTRTAYNGANQQTTFGDKTLTYDNNGNLTSIVDASGTTLYTWNARNQLTGISGPGTSASFIYDGLGRREKKTINGSLTEFLYDGVNPVQETSGTTVLANILTGLGVDEFLTRTDVVAATTSHLLPDALGSALALADASGAVQTEYTYEPFGKTTAAGISSANSFQYTGRENDGTGLYSYRARYYHPGLQRFISEDPVEFYGGSTDLYLYTKDSPTNLVDPSGEFWIPGIIAGGGALVGGITEGYQAYKCYGVGQEFAKAIGRGMVAGGVGALAGLLAGEYNPYAGGAAAALTYDVINSALGKQVGPAQTALNMALAAGTAGIANKLLLSGRGGWNFNLWTSPRTFGPRAVRAYELAEIGYAADLLLKDELPDLSGRGSCACK